jgi:hypothetical protein
MGSISTIQAFIPGLASLRGVPKARSGSTDGSKRYNAPGKAARVAE